jgi:hypothetical protein
MSDNYVVAICTLGENPNLLQCVSKLLEIKSATNCQLKILVVFNRDESEFVFDSRVQVVFEPNRGYSNVRNRAIDVTPEDFHLIFLIIGSFADYQVGKLIRFLHREIGLGL